RPTTTNVSCFLLLDLSRPNRLAKRRTPSSLARGAAKAFGSSAASCKAVTSFEQCEGRQVSYRSSSAERDSLTQNHDGSAPFKSLPAFMVKNLSWRPATRDRYSFAIDENPRLSGLLWFPLDN